MLTSSHYTPRDKREILAQVPIFRAISTMIVAVKADSSTPLQDVRNAAIAAKRQMVLFYMVGKYGWQTALYTLSNQVDKDLGMPKAEHPPQQPIIRTIAPRSSHSGSSRRSQGRSKPASRVNGGAPRQ